MRSTIKHQLLQVGLAVLLSLAMMACNRNSDKNPSDPSMVHQAYIVKDSALITSYPNGLRLYVVEQGPGDFPSNGINVRMFYQGRLGNGQIFDDSFSKIKPFQFTLGSGIVIAGIEEAVKKLRMGSKAVAIIPPSLGYGDGKGENSLPPKIPANATLTFDIDLIGSF